MPTTTIYVREADLPIIERAKKKLGDSLSARFIDCLRRDLERIPVAKGKTGKITLEIRKSPSSPTIRKTFEGRWLIDEDNKIWAEGDEDSANRHNNYTSFRLAQTRKGALVVYQVNLYPDDDGTASMAVYDSFDELKNAKDDGIQRYSDHVITAFADALGEPYAIELDI